MNYNSASEITYYKEVLKSNLYGNNDAYILVKGDVTITANPQIQLSFKNWAPFIKCIIKIDKKAIDYADDLI